MKNIHRDRSGLGIAGTSILLIIVVVLLLLGLGVAQPLVMDQKLSPGDSLTYEFEISGGVDASGELKYRILSMTLVDLEIEQTDADDVVNVYTTDWERDGRMLILDGFGGETPFSFMQTVLSNSDDFDKTMSFGLVGLTPMALDVYTGEVGGIDMVVKTKMGTAIPVEIVVTDGPITLTMKLTDTNIYWLSVPMALL